MRCAEFYEKWKKHPQFCELSKKSIGMIDAYIDLGDLIVSRGIDEKSVYINFPEGVARPLIQIKEPEVRVEALNFVMGYLKKNEKVPARDLKNLISGLTKKDRVTKNNADARGDDGTIVPSVRPVPEVKPDLPQSPFQPAANSIAVTDSPPQPSLAEQLNTSSLPPLSADAPMSEKLKRDYLLLEMAQAEAPAKPLPGSWISAPSRNIEEVRKAERERLEATAESLLIQMPRSTQLIVTDLLREHPGWKVKDAFYYGIEALAQKVVRR